MSDRKKLVTHNGSFHADDLFACAILSILLDKRDEKYEIIRTRDEEIVKNGDFVFDVGGIYDPEKNRFDHHQKEGAGNRENGIPYSSFGLVWKHFGMEICDGDKDAWQIIDTKIVSSVDARDNGFNIYTPKYEDVTPYSGAQPFLIFSPTWKEGDAKTDDIFREQVKNAVKVLKREIEVAKIDSEGIRIIIEQYKKAEDKRIIELPYSFPRYLYQNTLSQFEEPIYLIYTSTHTQAWKVEAIQKSRSTMESRKLFPETWRGFLTNDKGLAEVTGVSDVVFCHRNGFLLGVNSREGAYKLAELALKS